jgi:AcrR family transcriptional regulator
VGAAIVEAAAAVFAEREDASVGGFASAAGVARKTVYRLLSGSQALLEALGSVAVEEARQGRR